MPALHVVAAARKWTSAFCGGRGVTSAVACTEARNWGAAALTKAAWWHLHIASVLTHLLHFCFFFYYAHHCLTSSEVQK